MRGNEQRTPEQVALYETHQWQCSMCGQVKPEVEFYRHRGHWTGHRCECVPCFKTKNQALKQRPEAKEQARIDADYRLYGIEPLDKGVMWYQQDMKCAICGCTLATRDSGCVDHDHLTGKVRGLLCRRCNLRLGVIESNPTFVERALGYLKSR